MARERKITLPIITQHLPSQFHTNGIFNLDQDKNGTHWVAWHCKGNIAYVFDPLAGPPDAPLKKYLLARMRNIVYNHFRVQSVTSDTCGEWCLWFLQLAQSTHNNPMEVLASKVKRTHAANEKMLQSWLQ